MLQDDVTLSYAPFMEPKPLSALLPDRFGPHSLLRSGAPPPLLLQPQMHNLEFTAGVAPAQRAACMPTALLQHQVGAQLQLLATPAPLQHQVVVQLHLFGSTSLQLCNMRLRMALLLPALLIQPPS